MWEINANIFTKLYTNRETHKENKLIYTNYYPNNNVKTLENPFEFCSHAKQTTVCEQLSKVYILQERGRE